jgi:hypothetical protein
MYKKGEKKKKKRDARDKNSIYCINILCGACHSRCFSSFCRKSFSHAEIDTETSKNSQASRLPDVYNDKNRRWKGQL